MSSAAGRPTQRQRPSDKGSVVLLEAHQVSDVMLWFVADQSTCLVNADQCLSTLEVMRTAYHIGEKAVLCIAAFRRTRPDHEICRDQDR